MNLPRIRFDANFGTPELGYYLLFDETALAGMGDALCEGTRVVLYEDGEMEVEAVLRLSDGGDLEHRAINLRRIRRP